MPDEVDLRSAHPLDICYCGDYRKDHKNGMGACIFNSGSRSDGHFGSGTCEKFRLDRRYDPAAVRVEFGNEKTKSVAIITTQGGSLSDDNLEDL